MAKPAEGGVIGTSSKPNPPEGEQHYVFTGEAIICGDNKDTLRILAEYALDPEDTRKVTCLCFLGNEQGLQSLMSVIVESGVAPKLMAKDKSLPDPSEGWDDESVLMKPEFIEQLGIELKGCEAYITTKYEANDYTNKSGVEIKGTQAKVISIRKYDGKKASGNTSVGAESGTDGKEESWD